MREGWGSRKGPGAWQTIRRLPASQATPEFNWRFRMPGEESITATGNRWKPLPDLMHFRVVRRRQAARRRSMG